MIRPESKREPLPEPKRYEPPRGGRYGRRRDWAVVKVGLRYLSLVKQKLPMNLGEFEEWLKQTEITVDPSEVSNFNAWAQNQPAGTSRHQFAEHTRGLFSTVDNPFDSRVEISDVEKEVK